MFEGFKKEQAAVKEEVFNAFVVVFFLLVLVITVSTRKYKKRLHLYVAIMIFYSELCIFMSYVKHAPSDFTCPKSKD